MTLPPPITSRSNARVKALRAAFSGSASKPGDLLAVEGEHLIAEAVRSGIELEAVFLRAGSERTLERSALADLQAKDCLVLSADAFDSAVDTGSPQGIAATFAIPARRLPPDDAISLVLVLEALQDPGNLGTLLRSAEAFGVSVVMMTPETASPWNAKAVRASAGSVFRVPVLRAPPNDIRARLSQMALPLLAAVARDAAAVLLTRTFLGDRCAVMIGNEGAGLSLEALAMADVRVTIPCDVESLNAAVAGSTLLYEAMRQRLARAGPEDVQ